MADSHSARTKAFISYSHADEKYLEQLSTHLEYYRRKRKLDIWSDQRISTGAVWEDEIRAVIASAKVAILLISAKFLASEFIASNELPPLLEAAEKDGLVIFPIILKPCAFQNSELARYQALNKPSEPLIGMTEAKQEETWAKLAEQVAAILEPAPSIRKEPGISLGTKEQRLNEEDEHNDIKREQTTSGPSSQSSWLKNIQMIAQLTGHTNGVTALALSPDNLTLVSGDTIGKVKIWDIAKKTSFTPEKVPIIPITVTFGGPALTLNSVTSIVFHPEGRTFFAGWQSGKINIWKCSTGELLGSMEAPNPSPSWFVAGKGVESLAVSPDGLVIISSGVGITETPDTYAYMPHGERRFPGQAGEFNLHLWKYPKTDKPINNEDYPYVYKFRSKGGETPSIAFSTKGHFFAVSRSNTGILIWNISQGKEGLPLKNIDDFYAFFTGITFHPDENLLAAINREGQCLIWDLPTGSIQKVLDPLSGKITAIAFSPRGSHLAVAHSSGAMGFRSSFSEEWIKPFKAHEQSISALVYSSDGHHLISGSLDKTIKVWEIIETDY